MLTLYMLSMLSNRLETQLASLLDMLPTKNAKGIGMTSMKTQIIY